LHHIYLVVALGRPSTPLKETKRRADRWGTRLDHEQAKIDALAAFWRPLNPLAQGPAGQGLFRRCAGSAFDSEDNFADATVRLKAYKAIDEDNGD
jgi:hypothetical protein